MDPNARVQEFEEFSSLPVPSVQDMVRKDSLSVPERYIQDSKDRPQYCSFCEDASGVPVINFSSLVNGDEDERKRLDLACTEWGFFQMIDHGVVEMLHKMKAAAAAFFNLSLEEKKNYAKEKNDFQGYGQINVVSDQHKLDWCDLIFLMILPQKYKQLQYWPLDIPGFREAVEGYAAEICKLNEVILANLSSLMGLKEDGLNKLHGEFTQGVRMNYYPPCSRPDVVLGISPHSDSGFLTYLVQDDEIIGLQIRHNGGWVPVKPIPNAIVVNVGDSLEGWSNGLYKSIEHRAVTNESATRMSIAVSMNPDSDFEIGPVETMVDNLNRPLMYKSIKYIDYIKHKFSKRLDGKASIEFLKIFK